MVFPGEEVLAGLPTKAMRKRAGPTKGFKAVVKTKPPPPKKKVAIKQVLPKPIRFRSTDKTGPTGPIARTNVGPTSSELLGKAFRGEVPGVGMLGGIGQGLGSLGVNIGRALLRSPGTRQAAEKLAGRATTLKPLLGRGPTLGQAAAFTGGVIAAETIIGAAGQALDIVDSKILQRRANQPTGGQQLMHPGTGRSMATLPAVGGHLPPGTTIVKTWHTGTAQFARLADGRMAVQRKDGTIKVWRPQKHIVIPRNPRVGTLIRADKRLQRLTTGLRKVVDRGRTKRK